MAETDVIKEFLVSLGFKVDAAQAKRFKDNVEGATDLAKKLGVATASAVAGTVAEVAEVSAAMEKLYYSSQRTGSAVQAMKSFDYGISQVGGSAEAAQQSLENLGRFIRLYPGSGQFLQQIGVDPAHVNSAAASMRDLVKVFQSMPVYQGLQYANVLGIDEQTYYALRSGELTQRIDEYNDRVAKAGVNTERAAASGKEFMVALRGVGAEVEVISTKLEDALAPWMTRRLHEMDDLLSDLVNDPQKVADTVKDGIKSSLDSLVPDSWKPIASDSANLDQWSKKLGNQQQVSDPRKSLIDFFTSSGFPAAAAEGIVNRLQLESGLKSDAIGDSGQAYGLFQAHKDWRNEFKKVMGHDIYGTGIMEQADFIRYALTESHDPDARGAGRALKDATDPHEAYRLFTNGFEKPLNRVGGASSVTATTTINVNGASSPEATARAVASQQNDVTKNLVRMTSGVPQ